MNPKKFISLLLVTVLFTALNIVSASGVPALDDWQALGPEGGWVNAIIQHPTDGNTLFLIPAGYTCRIHKSIDGGMTWTPFSTINTQISRLVISSSNPSIFYAISYGRVYKSTDSGQTWSQVFSNYDYRFENIYIDPSNSDNLYAGGPYYNGIDYIASIYISTDGGENWTIKESGRFINGILMAAHHSNLTTFFLAGRDADYNPVVLKTTDTGNHWEDLSSHFDGYLYDIQIAPSDPARIYGASFYDVYRSSNTGSTWQKNTGYVYTNTLTVDPVNPDNVYTGYSNRIYRSSNGGQSFTIMQNGLEDAGICTSLMVSRTNSDHIFYNSRAGIFYSGNRGDSWQTKNSGLLLTDIASIASAPSAPSTLFIAVDNVGIFKTTNALGKTAAPRSMTWQALEKFAYCEDACDLLIDKVNPDILYVLVGYS